MDGSAAEQIATLSADNESLVRHLEVAAANIERLSAVNRELKDKLARTRTSER